MFRILIDLPNQPEAELPLPKGIYKVGASTETHIQLPYPGVAPVHCRFAVDDTSLRVLDLGSRTGTFINGVKLRSGEAVAAAPGSVISIGEVSIRSIGPDEPQQEQVKSQQEQVKSQQAQAQEQVRQSASPRHVASEAVSPSPQESGSADSPASQGRGDVFLSSLKDADSSNDPDRIPVLSISGIPDSARPFVQEIKKRAHVELLKRLNLKRMAMSGSTAQGELDRKAGQTIHEILSELSIPLPPGVTQLKIEKELYDEAIGLGPLEALIARDDITEIMVNGPDHVYVEHKGVIYRTDMSFSGPHQVMAAIERIVSPLGRRIDESSPMVDARLKDGSRVNAIIPPLSLVGPSITIRKFAKKPLQVADLVRFGSISDDIAKFLDVCVKLRKNIVISGGTGSGKTTLLNILSGFLPNRERIVTIEDAAELQLRQEHIVRLESRPANIEGKGEIAIRDLVRNALRMRPDRIVIGECRGGEALDMLQAMNTGHDGSLTTIHANSPRDCLSRLETLVLMAGFDLPLRAIREQIASAITIIVQISREKDGSRKVTCVSEITKMEGEIITMQDIFVYKQDGWTEDGKMTGSYVPTGAVPTFMDEIRRANLALDIGMFTPPRKPRTGGMF